MQTVFHTPFLRAIFAVSVSIWLTACSPSDTDKNTQDRFHLEYASMKDIRDINPHLYLGEMAAQAMVQKPWPETPFPLRRGEARYLGYLSCWRITEGHELESFYRYHPANKLSAN